jgi:hypothetical protein
VYYCYVCGAPTEDPPRGENGHTPLFEFCPCCGCEYGYQDASTKGIETLRAKWLAGGGKWREPELKPPSPTLEKQLRQIPKELPVGIFKNS